MQVLPTDVLLEIFLYLDDYSSLSRSMSVSRYWYERIKTIDFPKSFFQVCLTKSITIPELHERYLDEKQFIIYITGHCTTYNNKVEEKYDEYNDDFSTHVETMIYYFPETQTRKIDVYYIHTEVDIYDERMNQDSKRHYKEICKVEDFVEEIAEDLRVNYIPNKWKCDNETTNFFVQRRIGGRILK